MRCPWKKVFSLEICPANPATRVHLLLGEVRGACMLLYPRPTQPSNSWISLGYIIINSLQYLQVFCCIHSYIRRGYIACEGNVIEGAIMGSLNSPSTTADEQPHIGIVGAGISGLRCADILLQQGFQVTMLEARNRIGGRVCHSVVGYLKSWN